MSLTNRRNVKVLAAIVGGSAIVTIGAMNAALVQEHGGQQDVAKSGSMTCRRHHHRDDAAHGARSRGGLAVDQGAGAAAEGGAGSPRLIS